MLSPDTIVARSPTAIDVRVGGGLVLHDPDSGRYVKLNATAAEIWYRLASPASLSALAAELAERHEIEPARAERDLGPALEALLDRGLARQVAARPG